jgi:dTDP-4-amino-4,6-dideoxygalactose transaminase
MQVPFFRPEMGDDEINEVIEVLKSGWLTSGPRVKRFESEFAQAVGAKHAIALNSCTAALHLAVEALGLKAGEGVLVPTQTFAATAEVVRYLGAIPILVDCDSTATNMCLEDAARKLSDLKAGKLPASIPASTRVVGIMPVHVGGLMMRIDAVRNFAHEHDLWIVEDAAHALPAAWKDESGAWQKCGENTADVTCYSFYANKTITTGEGGMAVTDDDALAERMRLMSLHGLSRDAWDRFSGGGVWDYKIVAPGFKYNLTDIAAAIGIHQLARAEELRLQRETVAKTYLRVLADIPEIELPPRGEDRVHSWHLFAIKLNLEKLILSRDEFVQQMRARGSAFSVHWRPLHLHPYYEEFGWQPQHLPTASRVWPRLISLPLFSSMRDDEVNHVTETLRALCREYSQ